MRIITFGITLCCLFILVKSIDEHRPKKKEKRQLDYGQSPHYPGALNYRLERRISNGQQSHYPPSQYYPGPRPYRKDPGQDLTANNHLSDPIDRGGSGDTIYIPHKPFIKVVEKPVYIKEPEPIIEIIIKESNVTLPPPPTEPPLPPQKKKKEEVQVFYVKYKKNPNGYGKDAVIYDKPIPAITPVIPEEPEPEEVWNEPPPQSGYGGYSNEVTEPPRPSTTLRTIIKPDSEVYHSPGNNVKVTFGKEGFDYDKRSSKPEDYNGPPQPRQEEQFPRARQLSSFSDVYFKRPAHNYHPTGSNEYRSEIRSPQPYRPFNNFPPSSNQYNSRPPNREFNTRPLPPFFPPPKHSYQNSPYAKPSNTPQSSRPSFPSFAHSISHPPPPQYQSQSKPHLSSPPHQPSSSRYQPQHQFSDALPPSQRKPVPYTPFENLRPSQPAFSHPLPAHQPHQSFNQPTPSPPTIHHQTPAPHHQPPQSAQNIQFRPENRFNTQQQLPAIHRPSPSFAEVNNQFKIVEQHKNNQQVLYQQQTIQNQPHLQNDNEQLQYQEHLNNLRTAQNVIPPGGELLQSVPKYEQHLIVDPTTGQLSKSSALQNSPGPTVGDSNKYNLDNHANRANKQTKSQQVNNPPQQNLQYVNSQDAQAPRQQVSTSQVYRTQRPVEQNNVRYYSSTTPKPTTTTKEPEKPSTTTKDPKVLEAQLPDEVPDELRQQLLSSGILNHADISILDYDKVGDIPLSALPPEQLANFYSAGGGQQLAAAGSEQLPQVAALTSRKDFTIQNQEMSAEESEISEVAVNPPADGVEMKVVKYDPDTDKGQKVQEAYVDDEAKQVDPVILNDNTYNRYLPLKINGTQFPIPDVPELKGKQISSVVVLAPINYDFANTRPKRDATSKDDIQLIQNEPLKRLLNNPTEENYKKFLENERNTAVAKQTVVLLVAGSQNDPTNKEIYMYDLTTNTVSKLNGELSSAFVEAAEANSTDNAKSDARNNVPSNGHDNDPSFSSASER